MTKTESKAHPFCLNKLTIQSLQGNCLIDDIWLSIFQYLDLKSTFILGQFHPLLLSLRSSIYQLAQSLSLSANQIFSIVLFPNAPCFQHCRIIIKFLVHTNHFRIRTRLRFQNIDNFLLLKDYLTPYHQVLLNIHPTYSPLDILQLLNHIPWKSLHCLKFSHNTINIDGLVQLSTIINGKSIPTLDLSSNGDIQLGTKLLFKKSFFITNLSLYRSIYDVQALANFIPSSKLENLDISCPGSISQIQYYGLLFQALEKSKIKQLNMNDCFLGDDESILFRFISMLPNTSITHLKIGNNSLGDLGLVSISRILPKTQIQLLHVDGCEEVNEGISKLSKALPNSQLLELDLYGLQFDENSQVELFHSLSQSRLQKLRLGGGNLTIMNLGFEKLGLILSKTKLSNLIITSARIDDYHIECLVKSLPHSKIDTIILNNNLITDKSMDLLSGILPETNITKLDVSYNKIERDFFELSNHITNSNLEYLDIGGNMKILEDSWDSLINRTVNRIWEMFGFQQPISSDRLIALACSLKDNKQLKYLNLSCIPIQIQVSTIFSQVLPSTKLYKLDLSRCQIDNHIIKILTVGIEQSNISDLILDNNQIGDQGIKSITTVLPTSKICSLQLFGNSFSMIGVDYLRDSLKDSKVNFIKVDHWVKEALKLYCGEDYIQIVESDRIHY
ncbi:hypothetical protein HDV02_003091 [Globomyces sp. JEL0801]|nr:hypothetical protein HDV02_003091 [Globomyces sp. JEL0801]